MNVRITDSDEQLLARITAGDEGALSAFYDRHAAGLYGLLCKMLDRREDADDVLQLLFLQIWKIAARYDSGRGSVKGWLILMARSRAKDLLRSRHKHESPVLLQGSDLQDPASTLEKLNQDSRLHRALQQVPTEQRSAIALAYFGGLTYEEVAREQTIPLGTVKTRIRAGLQRLRDLLTAERPLKS